MGNYHIISRMNRSGRRINPIHLDKATRLQQLIDILARGGQLGQKLLKEFWKLQDLLKFTNDEIDYCIEAREKWFAETDKEWVEIEKELKEHGEL